MFKNNTEKRLNIEILSHESFKEQRNAMHIFYNSYSHSYSNSCIGICR